MRRPDHTIDAYLDGQITPEEVAALEAWLAADPANAADFLAAVQLHRQVGDRLRRQSLNRSLRLVGGEGLNADDSGAAMALAELAKLHDEGVKQLEQR